jgi:hypothetical protein
MVSAHSAIAVRCCTLRQQVRPVTMSNFASTKAASKLSKDINLEAGGLMRVALDRESPLYQLIYNQRTSCERINSQAKDLGIERPKARNIRSIRTLNTLIYLTINLKALQKAQGINASLLSFPLTLAS